MKDFTEITEVLIEQMRDGDRNWVMPWHGRRRLPINVSAGKPYRGMNRLILWAKKDKAGFRSDNWGTFAQWRARRQPVERGSTGTWLVMPRFKKNKQGEEELAGFRQFVVFNGDQVLNRDEQHPDMFGDDVERDSDVERWANELGAQIEYGQEKACYLPAKDVIRMPAPESFMSTQFSTATQNFYSTLLHELIHWTGHESRLDRQHGLASRRERYAFEELVAELGASFLCAEFRLADVPRKDHAQYLNGWLTVLESHPDILWKASRLAQEATDWLLKIEQDDPADDDSLPDWFEAQPTQRDMFAPKVLGT